MVLDVSVRAGYTSRVGSFQRFGLIVIIRKNYWKVKSLEIRSFLQRLLLWALSKMYGLHKRQEGRTNTYFVQTGILFCVKVKPLIISE